MFARKLRENEISPTTYVASKQENTIKYNEKEDEVVRVQKKINNIELKIQEIKQNITYMKIKQNNVSEKFEDVITQQSKDTGDMEMICNKLN